MNVNDMGLDELRLAVQELRRYVEIPPAEFEQLRAIVNQVPAQTILNACRLIEQAEASAPPNRRACQHMAIGDVQGCLSALCDCREAAEAVRALEDGDN